MGNIATIQTTKSQTRISLRNELIIFFSLLVFGLVVGTIGALSLNNFLFFLYITTYIVLLFLFLKVNHYQLINISTFFVFYLSYAVLLGPLFGWGFNITYVSNPFIFLLGFALFIVGLSFYNKKYYDKPLKSREFPGIFHFNKLFVVLVFYFLGIAACLYYFMINRQALSSDLNAGRATALSGNGLLILFIKSLSITTAMLLELCLKGKISKVTYVLLLGVAVVSSFIVGFKAIPITIAIVSALIYANNKKLSLKTVLIILIFIFVSYLLLQAIRDSVSATKTNDSLIKRLKMMYVDSINFDRVVYWFPKNTGFQYGSTLLINFKMLLPGPDMDFTTWLKTTLQMTYDGGGFTPTIFGDFYINFSYPGIFVGMLLYGVVCGFINKRYEKTKINWLVAYVSWEFVHSITGGLSNVLMDMVVFTILGIFIESISQEKVYYVRVTQLKLE